MMENLLMPTSIFCASCEADRYQTKSIHVPAAKRMRIAAMVAPYS
jgi:hypothetical protein